MSLKMVRSLAIVSLSVWLALWGGGEGMADADDGQTVPQGVIVSSPQSKLSIEVKTDYSLYSPGEPVKIHLKLSRDAYVYLYDIDPQGNVTLLFPNGFSRDNHLKAGVHILPERADYSFVVEEPLGVETLQALALLKPIPLLSLGSQGDLDEYVFPQLSEDPLAWKPKVKELIEITVEPDEWAAAWTRFLVTPAVAHLLLSSQPQGAQVYVNGELRGESPLALDLEPGRVHLMLIKEGYRRWSSTITLKNHSFRELNVRLKPVGITLPFQPSGEAPEEDGFVPLFSPALGMNAGLNSKNVFSVGVELGLAANLSLGGSVSFTQQEVPEYFDLGRPQKFARERVYNRGPETEAYLKLSLPLSGAFHIQLGGGISVQERVHIAIPPGVIIVEALTVAPHIEVLPNGYRETVSYLTALGGVALESDSGSLSLSYHNRRGWVLGLTLRF